MNLWLVGVVNLYEFFGGDWDGSGGCGRGNFFM